MSVTQSSNNRAETAVSISESTLINPSNSVQVFELYEGTKDNTYAFYTGEGYIYAASSSSNYLRTENDLTDNSSWTITINPDDSYASITAQGNNTRNLLKYNSSSDCFSCYASGQSAVKLYQISESSFEYKSISYELNGGTNNFNNPELLVPNKGSFPLNNPTKRGYTFSGWYDNQSFNGNALTEIPTSVVDDTTIYAKWTPNTETSVFMQGALAYSDVYKGAVRVVGLVDADSYDNYGFAIKVEDHEEQLLSIEADGSGLKVYEAIRGEQSDARITAESLGGTLLFGIEIYNIPEGSYTISAASWIEDNGVKTYSPTKVYTVVVSTSTGVTVNLA